MTLSIFGLLFGVIGGAIILGACFLFFKFKNQFKRKNKKDISKFTSGYQHHSFSVDALLTATKKKEVQQFLSAYNAEFIKGNKDELIVYLNNFKQAFLHGTQSVAWEKLAMRIVIHQKGGITQVTMDDDYGIKKKRYEKMATPEMKNDFIQKCTKAFTHYQEKITTILQD